MIAQTRRLSLDLGSGEALRLVEVLVGKRARHDFDPSRAPHLGSEDLVEAVARTITAACTGLLLTHGAAPRTVLRDGRRVRGRVWDPEPNTIDGVRFSLRFSDATDALWREAVVVLGGLLVKPRVDRGEAEARERNRKLFREFATLPARTAGDHLFFALVHQNLGRLGLTGPSHQRASVRLRQGSAFVRLLAPSGEGPAPSAAWLADPHLVRTVELVLPWIGRAWADALPELWSAETLPLALARCESWRATLEAYAAGLERRERMDLVDPIVEATAAILDHPTVRGSLTGLPSVRTMADRDQLGAALGAGIDPGRLDGWRVAWSAHRYGDERYVETRLGLEVLDQRWVPQSAEVRAVVRRIEGRVG